MLKILPIIFCLVFTSCGTNTEFMTRYHEDGRAKPLVAVASLIDTTNFDVPWSLSEELTSNIVQNMATKNTIFVESQEDNAFSENPFSGNLSWVKNEFPAHEFVVFLELVEHELLPAKGKENASLRDVSTNLNMSVRLRVLDLRSSTPKVVLQEMVKDSYFIPKTLIPTNYHIVTWGTDSYPKTPMGIAHIRLTDEIASRVGDYILLAKSR